MPIEADVCVVGAGAAGLRAALEAKRRGARTVVLSKGRRGRSGATFYPASPVRGMQVATTPAEIRSFIEDAMLAGLGAADARLVEILAAESLPRFRDLAALGVPFAAERVAGCFSTEKRAYVVSDLAAFGRAFSDVEIMERAMAVDVAPGRGVRAITPAGDELVVEAPAIVLATGGGCGAFKHALTSPDQLGDAIALASDAGVTNLEFLQIMIGTLKPVYYGFYPVPLHPDAIRRSHFPFSTRDEGFKADLAVARGGRIGGHDVLPMAHAQNGGLAIDERGGTGVPGLFACGEAAGGMHGADRVGGAMMTATQVFGARAGASAASFKTRDKAVFEPLRTDPRGLGVGEIRQIRAALAGLLQQTALLIRKPREMERAAACVAVWRSVLDDKPARDRASLWAWVNARHAVRYAEALYRSMRARPASLGPHYIA